MPDAVVHNPLNFVFGEGIVEKPYFVHDTSGEEPGAFVGSEPRRLVLCLELELRHALRDFLLAVDIDTRRFAIIGVRDVIPRASLNGYAAADVPRIGPTAQQVSVVFVWDIAVVALIPDGKIVLLSTDVGKLNPQDEAHLIRYRTLADRDSDGAALLNLGRAIKFAIHPFAFGNLAVKSVFGCVFGDIALAFIQ